MRCLVTNLGGILLVGLVALSAGGCTKKLLPVSTRNQPPETTLFIQAAADTVNHIAHLYWYGSDQDGYVRKYQIKVSNPADTVAADSAWQDTDQTEMLFTFIAPDGYTRLVFRVRAVDDKGAVDPEPAVQMFQFSNLPPVVTLTSKPNRLDRSDTTYASVTVGWSVTDRDGDANKVVSHVWLDRMSGDPILATGRSLTVPSERFKIDGAYVAGRRTLYIQGVDDGGMAGPIDSASWYVRKAVTGTRARVLFIDEQGLNDTPKAINDSIYIRAAQQLGVARDQWSYLWLAKVQPFKSDADMYQTMKFFEAVVWFRGVQNTLGYSSVLSNYKGGVGRYLEDSGNLYLETQYMASGLSTTGALDDAFLDKYLNSNGVFQFATPPDSSAQYAVNKFDATDVSKGGKLYCDATGDTLVCTGAVSYARAFRTREQSQVWISAPAGALSPANPIPMPVGLNVLQPSGGRFVVNTFPLIAGGLTKAGLVARNIMHQLGLDRP